MAVHVENDIAEFWIKDGILHAYYKKGCIIEIEEAKQVVKLRLEFQNGKNYNILGYVDHLAKISTEARKFYAKEGYEGINKLALLFSTPGKTLLGNLYLKLDKPIKPTKLFTSPEEAITWLKS